MSENIRQAVGFLKAELKSKLQEVAILKETIAALEKQLPLFASEPEPKPVATDASVAGHERKIGWAEAIRLIFEDKTGLTLGEVCDEIIARGYASALTPSNRATISGALMRFAEGGELLKEGRAFWRVPDTTKQADELSQKVEEGSVAAEPSS